MTICRLCNSNKIIDNVVVRDDAYKGRTAIVLEVYADPTAIFFNGAKSSEMKCKVCADCGHVEFFAKNPAVLYQVLPNATSNAKF
jgi:formate-dependent nitrite reductase cytochrome c552 subunit